jgi:hypothetical protein
MTDLRPINEERFEDSESVSMMEALEEGAVSICDLSSRRLGETDSNLKSNSDMSLAA